MNNSNICLKRNKVYDSNDKVSHQICWVQIITLPVKYYLLRTAKDKVDKLRNKFQVDLGAVKTLNHPKKDYPTDSGQYFKKSF